MSEDNSNNNETIITDIRMQFGSMVIFMVKLAIASIPAIMILFLLAVALAGFIAGLGITLSN